MYGYMLCCVTYVFYVCLLGYVCMYVTSCTLFMFSMYDMYVCDFLYVCMIVKLCCVYMYVKYVC